MSSHEALPSAARQSSVTSAETITIILATVGGLGVIIVGLSSWLDKVREARIQEADRARFSRKIQTLESSFESRRTLELEQTYLAIQKTKIELRKLEQDAKPAFCKTITRSNSPRTRVSPFAVRRTQSVFHRHA
jgi:hypothetical protein